MKAKYIKHMAAAALMGAAMTACNDFTTDAPAFEVPQASLKANTTILEVKTKWWDDAANYIQQIPVNENGSHVIIKGRVISDDRAGNVYKSLWIMDETAGLPMSIDRSNLHTFYAYGQEVVIDLTEMYIGKYSGLEQLGFPSFYTAGNTYQASFMPFVFFQEHAQLNGLPDTSAVEITDVWSYSDMSTTAEGVQYWSGRIVRLHDVQFVDGGKEAFTDGYKLSTSRSLADANGKTYDVYTSGYSTFRNQTLPEGPVDLVCLVGYHNGAYQFILNSYAQAMGQPTYKPGSLNNPWTVEEAVAIEKAEGYANDTEGWVQGFIVGCVAPNVQSITSVDDIYWDGTDVLAATLVIAPEPDCRDLDRLIVFELPMNTKLEQLGNLQANPANLGKLMKVKGFLAPLLDIAGMVRISGDLDSFWIEGMEDIEEPEYNGNGSEEKPYTVADVVKFNPQSTTDVAADDQKGVWVKGYIVGSYKDYTSNIGLTNANNQNVLIGESPSSTEDLVCVQLPYGDIRTAVNLVNNPGNLGKLLEIKGDILKYNSLPGVKNPTAFKLDGTSGGGDNPGGDTPSGEITGSGTKESPYNVTSVIAVNPQSTTEVSDTKYAGCWVEGYIVGYYADYAMHFSADGAPNVNLLLGLTASSNSSSDVICVQLPYGDVRTALNLKDNAGNMGKFVKLKGDILKYNSMPGLKNVTEFEMDGTSSGGGGDEPSTGGGDTPSADPSGAGTEADPYSVTAVVAVNPQSTTEVSDAKYAGCWVEGYVVGYYANYAMHFTAEGATNVNLLLGQTSLSTSASDVICVQIPYGDLRPVLNLQDNPGNLGRKLKLKGDILKYNSMPGLKNTSEYKFE